MRRSREFIYRWSKQGVSKDDLTSTSGKQCIEAMAKVRKAYQCAFSATHRSNLVVGHAALHRKVGPSPPSSDVLLVAIPSPAFSII